MSGDKWCFSKGKMSLGTTILQVQSDLTFWLISILLAIIAGLIAVIGLGLGWPLPA